MQKVEYFSVKGFDTDETYQEYLQVPKKLNVKI